MIKTKTKTLGVIGGLGPMATAYYMELVIQMTDASCDQEHLNMIISSRPGTPDRTRYILGLSDENPAPVMIDAGRWLVAEGAEILAIPCITAHYFQKQLEEEIHTPVIHLIKETVHHMRDYGVRKAGIGGKDLGTVQNPVVPILHGGGLRALDIRTGIGFRQSKTPHLAAIHQGPQILLFLFFRSKVIDAGTAQGGMYRNGNACTGIYFGKLLHAQRIGQGVGAGPSIRSGIWNSQKAVPLQLGQKLHIIGFVFIHLFGQRLDFCLRKFAEQLLLEQMHLV